MKVFISWSKNSRSFAGVLNEAMGRLFDQVTTFYSPEIPAGEMWLKEIEEELTDTDFGIICVTRENQKEQWLNYEAGALARQVTDRRKRLGVLLLDFEDTSDVTGPFKNFQMKMADLDGFRALMHSANSLGPNIKGATVDMRVDAEWPALQAAITQLKESPDQPKTPDRGIHEKVDELLALVRVFDQAATPPVVTPFAVSADERHNGRQFLTQAYKSVRGRAAHFDFRPLSETTDVLDSLISISELEKKQIEYYYRVSFPDPSKKLIIADASWKDEFISASGDRPNSRDLADPT